jgi:tight adherence protein B
MIDYSEYRFNRSQYITTVLAAGAAYFTIGFVFYHHLAVALAFSLMGFHYTGVRKRQLIRNRKDELGRQFKQALYSLSSALAAGKSVENAFREAIEDLKLLYPDPDTFIIAEFEVIGRKIEMGDPVEMAVGEFSKRADVEDITHFADIFAVCKRTGGDLVQVIRRTAVMLGEKMEVRQELSVLIAQKRLESQIMTFAPIVVIAALSFSSPDYMAPLYQPAGYAIMTVSLAVIILCYRITKRIMDFRV